MKLHRIALSIAICALMSVAVSANVKSRNVTFDKDLKIAGTTIKKGSYKVSFDEEKNELAIFSGSREIARSTAQLKERKSSSKYATLYTSIKDESGDQLLLSVNMGGKHAVVNDQYTARATGASSSGGAN